LIIFVEDLINSIASTVTANKSVRRCEKNFYECLKPAQTFWST